jgi:hypothetical protein
MIFTPDSNQNPKTESTDRYGNEYSVGFVTGMVCIGTYDSIFLTQEQARELGEALIFLSIQTIHPEVVVPRLPKIPEGRRNYYRSDTFGEHFPYIFRFDIDTFDGEVITKDFDVQRILSSFAPVPGKRINVKVQKDGFNLFYLTSGEGGER